jgi:predicted metal-dependent hydrolase
MPPQTIQIADIGTVLFEYSKKAKRINISVKHPAKIRVAIPEGISLEKAKKFAISKEVWIKRSLIKLKLRVKIPLSSNPIDLEYGKSYLSTRLEELSIKHGFKYNKVTIKNQKTRWGSCSGYNNISLNLNLITLPSNLIDYVILHELVHTLIKNHSPLFWSSLDKYVGNAKSLNKELKKYILS